MSAPAVQKKILIIDDTVDTVATLFELLTYEGYAVATATDGFQALEIAARTRPDLIVCDLMMPGMDGMQVLEKVRTIVPGQRFLFLTAYGSFPRYIEALERGAADMIQKPCANADFLSAVERALKEADKVT